LFMIMIVHHILFGIVKVIMVAFLVVIVVCDCQLVHGMKRGRFSMLMDRNRILEAIWKSLVVLVAEDIITLVQLCYVLHKFHIVDDNSIYRLYLEIIN